MPSARAAGLRPQPPAASSQSSIPIAGHTALPWRVEEGTDLIWGACNPDDRSTYGMGYPVAQGRAPHHWQDGRPDEFEREANAAFIVRACNSHYELLEALERLRKATLDDRQDISAARSAASAVMAKATGAA